MHGPGSTVDPPQTSRSVPTSPPRRSSRTGEEKGGFTDGRLDSPGVYRFLLPWNPLGTPGTASGGPLPTTHTTPPPHRLLRPDPRVSLSSSTPPPGPVHTRTRTSTHTYVPTRRTRGAHSHVCTRTQAAPEPNGQDTKLNHETRKEDVEFRSYLRVMVRGLLV